MNGAGGNIEEVAPLHRVPFHQFFNIANQCCMPHRLSGYRLLKSNPECRIGLCINYQPALFLAAAGFAERGGLFIIWMHLNGQFFTCEDILHQNAGDFCRWFKPYFTYPLTIRRNERCWQNVFAPRLFDHPLC